MDKYGSLPINPRKWALALKLAELSIEAGAENMLVELDNLKTPTTEPLCKVFQSVVETCQVTEKIGLLGSFIQEPVSLCAGMLYKDTMDWVQVNPLVRWFLPDDLLAAGIAHEIGHVVHGDPAWRRSTCELLEKRGFEFSDFEELPDKEMEKLSPIFHASEFAADEFAKTHGYGDKMAELLEITAPCHHPKCDWGTGGPTHPPSMERVRRLLA